MSQLNFEELYLMALQNSPKPKSTINWVHVERHGPGSTKAHQICRHFGIDPEGTVFEAENKEGLSMNIILTEADLDVALENGDSYRDVLNHVAFLLIEKVLVKTRGNKTEAAQILGMNRETLNKVIKRVNTKREEA
ncbi:helix-turn-helix domain-containing protein [Acinetobacter calcoaceticus]|uniref:helix-turn-helix domain-containing protein n=1 Tax=Acinetobacter calcoaceticus TaxID=471 RepID=UPI001D0EBF8B|nr:helix-turn-helix domain-containing protein [Acinetobacter calcoaceticus]